VFPTSLAALAVIGTVAALRSRSWVWAGVCAAVGVASYPSTILLAVLAPLAILLGWRHESVSRRLVHAGAVAAMGAAAFAAVLGAFAVDAGRWDAYWLIQRNYDDGTDPLTGLGRVFADGLNVALIASWVSATVLAVAAVTVGVRTGRRAGFDAPLWFALASTVCWWLVPLVTGPELSPYRTFALMVPAVLLVRDAPERWRLFLLALAGLTTGVLTWAYYLGVAI
jgi:hypothetical protein